MTSSQLSNAGYDIAWNDTPNRSLPEVLAAIETTFGLKAIR